MIPVNDTPPQNGLNVWLDAAYTGSVMYQETTGDSFAFMGDNVGRWVSRHNGNNACTFDRLGADACQAVWSYDPVRQINLRPVVCISGGPGRFSLDPLQGVATGTGWTVVAVWRLRYASTGTATGHPFAVNGGRDVQFGNATWSESLGTAKPRDVITNLNSSPLNAPDGTVFCALWDYQPSTGTLRWGVMTAQGTVAAVAGTVNETDEVAWRTGLAPVVNGMGSTRALDLAELMVWSRAITSNHIPGNRNVLAPSSEQTTVIRDYLGVKWGFNGSLLLAASPTALPAPYGPNFPDASQIDLPVGTMVKTWNTRNIPLIDSGSGHEVVLTASGRLGLNNAKSGGNGLSFNTSVAPFSKMAVDNRTWTVVFQMNSWASAATLLSWVSALNLVWRPFLTPVRKVQLQRAGFLIDVFAGNLPLGVTNVVSFSWATNGTTTAGLCYKFNGDPTVTTSLTGSSVWTEPTAGTLSNIVVTPPPSQSNYTLMELSFTEGIRTAAEMDALHQAMVTKWG